MTATSFNPIQMQQNPITANNQPLALKQGQVFHGTIKKLYPDQMAEIQVGNQKFIAKLEVPLKAGDAHFFQVTGTDPQAELKVVSGPMTPTTSPSQQINQLLESMNLPKSAEMQQLLGHFMKAELPISKDQLLQAEMWLKALPEGISKMDALQTIQKMIELKMPMTNEVFQALMSGQKTSGMAAIMENFAQLLAKDTALPEQLKQNLMQQVQAITKPFEVETGSVVLAKVLESLTNNAATTSEKMQALSILKESGIIPNQATLQNWSSMNEGKASQQMQQAGQVVQTILTTKPENAAQLIEQLKSWTTNQQFLTNDQKQQINQLIDRFNQLPVTKQTVDIFAKQMQDQLLKAFSQNTSNHLFTQDIKGLSVKDHLLSLLKQEVASPLQNEAFMRNLVKNSIASSQPFIQQIVTQADALVQNSMDSKAMEHAMKTVLKNLGISYEATLGNKSADLQMIAHQLKPQLHTLLQETNMTPQLKEAAEMLMTRMNGMQLSSGENGHQHQLIMQVPLEFFGKRMDATLQWNGRMKDDGKIDANYARVLFYLQMASMQETVIDMQVQNRVVTVTVFNEHLEIQSIAEPLKAALKVGLAEKNYQLSGVFMKQFDKGQAVKNSPVVEQQEEQSGVDIRV
ncbi:hypothetical protein [Lysinibacillus fusiformis]|uniref:Uncharacterized protein n=1 Tax=Lysinibacillus fusiformis TaxID=28031 RepID=A0A1H9D8F2_9BACI|nr:MULTISPECIES: hypothetical protein [Lysinibacillus]MED4668636.1 hypothetical protein [Lysinibacillus fusiformis]PCD83722.1 hypothetical protein CNQ87_04815 [Lysinibacillus fusiformis]QAS59018.1 hypothetical protein LSP_23085 [Lysinibacillus sphaericus]RDV28400.1 hypothetical protein C7B90_17475 [Lysinibacillus fusiformis]SCY06971.1 hypothetical protein SAMN02787081_01088 [Lysinibacillus fusiformis]